jgi:hypothetical protein
MIDAEGLRGDWSLSHLLDEVWLRARRVLIHRLDAAGLWVGKLEYQAFLERQRAIGDKLRTGLLAGVLGAEDSLCLHSERAFRAANARVRGRINLVMAFGYGLGEGLAGLASDAGAGQVADLCALFNLGISLFDIIVDQLPELHSALQRNFDKYMLLELATNAGAVQRYQDLLEQVVDDEIRILLKIVVSFFRELHFLNAATCRQHSPELTSLLEKAYIAELSSMYEAGGTDPHQTAEAKSTLPFIIIGQIARLGASSASNRAGARIDGLAADIGSIFWLVDDLADLVGDLRSRSLNGVLLRCELTPAASRDSALLYRRVGDLLAGPLIEETATKVATQLGSVERVLTSFDQHKESAHRIRQTIRCFVRSWVT